MIENLARETDVPSMVANSEALFIANLNNTLRSNAFSNRMLIAPRRLGTMAQEEFANFCQFLESRDSQQTTAHGCEMAFAGFGHRSMLGLCTALRQSCLDLNMPDGEFRQEVFELVEQYTSATLEGYMTGREDELRQEQERTRNAFFRTQS